MKEEALKLADWLDNGEVERYDIDEASAMIRRLIEELDEKNYRILELTKRYKALTWNDRQGEPVAWVVDLEANMNGFIDCMAYKEGEFTKPLYTTPQTKPTITKLDGKVVAVTMTDDEHRITEVLWEASKPLSDEEIEEVINKHWNREYGNRNMLTLCRAIEERHGIK